MDQVNATLSASTASRNLKAKKNLSVECRSLINHDPMNVFVKNMRQSDAMDFMNQQLNKRKPIFKNYIHNNASILRAETQ